MKAANRNLLLLGIPSLLILGLGIFLFTLGNATLAQAGKLVPDSPSGPVGDVEGYAMIFGFLGAGLGGLAGFLAQLLALLFILYGGSILLLTLVARLLYRTSPGRLLAYRVLMGIALVVTILPGPELFSYFWSSLFQGHFSLVTLLALAAMALVAVAGYRNTFTHRILEP